jgi:hypothetical protein
MKRQQLKTIAALAAGGLAVALSFAPEAVFALPVYAQQTGKPCGYCHVNQASGGALTPNGRSYRANRHTLGPADSDRYSAVALSPSSMIGRWPGWLTSERAAEMSALALCGRVASDCQLILTVRNQCFAVAKSRTAWGIGGGSVAATAEADAIRDCQAKGAACSITSSQCPYRSAAPVYAGRPVVRGETASRPSCEYGVGLTEQERFDATGDWKATGLKAYQAAMQAATGSDSVKRAWGAALVARMNLEYQLCREGNLRR